MSDKNEDAAEAPEADAAAAIESGKKPFPLKGALLSAVGALALGGAAGVAGFFIAPGANNCASGAQAAAAKPAAKPHAKADVKDVAFVNMEPLVISLGPDAKSKYLKISISLETTKTNEKTLTELSPRIRDILNSYLRAVEESDLERPAGMTRLRAQMLRRLQLVTPEGAIGDILITDFVLT